MNRFAVELRSAEVDGSRLAGHAVVWDSHAQAKGHWETMARSAFDEVLRSEPDTVALLNHNPSMILGSTRAKTLALEVDDVGLAFELDLPDTTYARDIRELVTRGDLRGCSFGFIPGADSWSRAPDGMQLRTHTAVSALKDVSLVTFPAYEGTEVALRHVDFSDPPPRSARSQMIRLRAAQLIQGK